MRERTTWNRTKIAELARGRSKVADPYTMNQPEHAKVQPTAEAYVTGGPSDFAEDVAPSGPRWEAEYSGGEVRRNELGMPEFRADTWNHAEKTAALKEATYRKAQVALRIARQMLKNASEAALEDQAYALMHLPSDALNSTYVRLAQEQEQDEESKKPWEDKQAQEQEQDEESKKPWEDKQAQEQEQEQDEGQDKQANIAQIVARAVQAALAGFKASQGQDQKGQDQGEKKQAQQQSDEKKDEQQGKQAQVQQDEKKDQGEQKEAKGPAFPGAAPPFGDKGEKKEDKEEGQSKEATLQILAQQVQALTAQIQRMASGQAPVASGTVQADGAMIDNMIADMGPCEQVPADFDLQLESPIVDVGEVQLGPEDADLMQLFATDEQEQEQEPAQQRQASAPHAVRTAATRTVGTRPTQGVSRISGTAGNASGVDPRLNGLWPSAPDVSHAFGLPKMLPVSAKSRDRRGLRLPAK
jgi:hypothetical protein